MYAVSPLALAIYSQHLNFKDIMFQGFACTLIPSPVPILFKLIYTFWECFDTTVIFLSQP